MEIPKDQILQLLRDRGDHGQADQHLPDQVDPKQHSDLLAKIGINPTDLMGDIAGKFGL